VMDSIVATVLRCSCECEAKSLKLQKTKLEIIS
jgi:hypothetical protein